jgi:curli biogenesis system outer membrane secretion channel CsgG
MIMGSMFRRLPAFGLLAALLAAGCASPPSLIPPPPEPFVTRPLKPVVAVTSFANRSGFEGQWQIGDGIADLLVLELKKSRRYEVLERQKLDLVFGELNMQNSNPLFRKEGRAALGQLKNCRFQIRGEINDFSQVGGGAFMLAVRNLFLFGRGCVAQVSLSLTVVDVETGVIVGSVACVGRAHARQAGFETEYKGVHFGGDAFYRTPIGSATREAIRGGVKKLLRDIPRQYWQPMICGIEEGAIILNGGIEEGYEVGRLYNVRKNPVPVTDPSTGDLLDWLPGSVVGTVRVVEVSPRISKASGVRGTGFARGQYLEPAEAYPAASP